MPQIWLTYDELAALIGCDASAARASAAAMPLDRRRSHDGLTRAKLNARLTEVFLERAVRRWINREVATCAGDLQMLRELMAAQAAVEDPPPLAMQAASGLDKLRLLESP